MIIIIIIRHNYDSEIFTDYSSYFFMYFYRSIFTYRHSLFFSFLLNTHTRMSCFTCFRNLQKIYYLRVCVRFAHKTFNIKSFQLKFLLFTPLDQIRLVWIFFCCIFSGYDVDVCVLFSDFGPYGLSEAVSFKMRTSRCITAHFTNEIVPRNQAVY